MPYRERLSADQVMVNELRRWLGKAPLYWETGHVGQEPKPPREACGNYLARERYSRLARPDCDRCGGGGLYDGWQLDMRCSCMGIAPKGNRGSGRHPHVKTLFAFSPKGPRP